MRFAIINQANLVINVIRWDGSPGWTPDEGYSAVELTNDDGPVGIGWTYDAAANPRFVPPPTPDEPEVEPAP